MTTYTVNEIFYSLQGEGLRAGTPNVFVRFTGCNLRCNEKEHGFDCDTEFTSGQKMTAEEILQAAERVAGEGNCRSVIFTGGEPALQLDSELLEAFEKWYTCIETNGTRPLPDRDISWLCVSPKSAEHTLRIDHPIHELKYVRNIGQGIPKPKLTALWYLISPAFNPDWSLSQEVLQWCIQLVRDNPAWRLSVQQHKEWGVR